ncbi:hypothetical protein M2D07_015830 [Pseudomonas sp. BGr12]|uniref:hypothetical protein n=1 Tax=Pseudomonas sp. BGr12 TaxID=2936269 RepID=UPI00255958C7|nr:hypothetical protein [Pseudomonas sp. BJa5]MDL2428489.1 hypothetical protein [Pseudomonas sp. BJa5]
MYLGFMVEEVQSLGFVTDREVFDFKDGQKGRFDDLTRYLIACCETHDVIDADKVSSHLFPQKEEMIFLSHSHLDEDEVVKFSVNMQKKGVGVFVDSCVWGYFKDFLDVVNEKYSNPRDVNGVKTYSYNSVSQVAANVHVTLSLALQRMINRTEVFLFLSTDNSIPLRRYELDDKTFSPWIASELQFSAMVQTQTPKRRRRMVAEAQDRGLDSSLEHYSKEMRMAFNAHVDHLPSVDGGDLASWFNADSNRGERLLDSMYDKFDLEQRFISLRYSALLSMV